jgi:hypothetical protein
VLPQLFSVLLQPASTLQAHQETVLLYALILLMKNVCESLVVGLRLRFQSIFPASARHPSETKPSHLAALLSSQVLDKSVVSQPPSPGPVIQ